MPDWALFNTPAQGRSEWLLTPPVAITLLVALAASLGWASGDYRLPLANIASAGSALLMVYTLGAGWQMNLARSDHPGEAYRRDAVALGWRPCVMTCARSASG
jgi:hypothetical protein